MQDFLLYGNRIGYIEFKCLRHPHTGTHKAILKMSDGGIFKEGVGLFETICPVCGRQYRMNTEGKLYCDRPLKVVSVDLNKDLLEKYIKLKNQG